MKYAADSIATLTLLALLLAACTGSTGGATIDGSVQGAQSSLLVSVAGTSSSSTTDSAGNFTLTGVPAGATQLRFSGPGVDASLTISKIFPAEVRTLAVNVSGGAATEMHERSGSDFEGVIEAISAPTLTVSGRTVTTTAATTITKAGAALAFTDLAVGDPVEVDGAIQSDGSILASSIDVGGPHEHGCPDGGPQHGDRGPLDGDDHGGHLDGGAGPGDPPGDPGHGGGPGDGHGPGCGPRPDGDTRVVGTIAALDTTAGTITIGATVIATNSATKFAGAGVASLADLSVGEIVEVDATRQSDGSLLANLVHTFDIPGPGQIEVRGTIDAVSATALSVAGQPFAVDAHTVVRRHDATIGVGDLAPGNTVEVHAQLQSGGAPPLATRIDVE